MPAGRHWLFVALAGENRGQKPSVFHQQKANQRRFQAWYIKQLKIAREKISSKVLDDLCDKEDFDEEQIKCYEDLKAEVKKEEIENKDQIDQIMNGNSQENQNAETEYKFLKKLIVELE